MFVDTELLHSGAGESRRAGEHTHHAVARLSRESLPSQMFGDFPAAAVFHEAAAAAQSQHLRVLSDHSANLAAVSDRAHRAAVEFISTEEDNARTVRGVRCCSAS